MSKSTNGEKKTVTQRLDESRSNVDNVMSFVDWIRYVFQWVKELFGRS